MGDHIEKQPDSIAVSGADEILKVLSAAQYWFDPVRAVGRIGGPDAVEVVGCDAVSR